MDRIARFVTTRAKTVLVASAMLVALFGFLGAGAFGVLKGQGFDDPKSESSRAYGELVDRYGSDPTLVLLVTPQTEGSLDSEGVATAAGKLVLALRSEPDVTSVQSYWPDQVPALRASDGSSALIIVAIGDHEDVRGAEIVEKYESWTPLFRLDAGGEIGANYAINEAVESGLSRAEAVAIPSTTALLIVAFGALVAALLPLMIGIIAILGALAALFVLGSLTDTSIYAINLVTAMGLGLAIDYALLIVNRFREQLALGNTVNEAVLRTMMTAGRTVVFSGLTVAVALASLLVFPAYFLRSFAYAGIAVVLVALFGAIVVLPAVLTLLGRRIDQLKLLGRSPQFGDSPVWHRIAKFVYRRPVLTGLPVLAALVIMALPAGHMAFATPDDRVLESGPSRTVGDALRTKYTGEGMNSMYLLFDRPAGAPESQQHAVAISELKGVAEVATLHGTARNGTFVAGDVSAAALPELQKAGGAMIRIATTLDPKSEAVQTLVDGIRDLPDPAGYTTVLGGGAPQLVDGKRAISDNLPLAVTLMVASTLVLLFLFTGSVPLALKALVLNVLTISAVMGAMTWVFQDGHFASLIGFTPQALSTTMPVLLFCIAFGLSMDYEVFLLSRIKEAHEAGASNEVAVVSGLSKVGRLVSTAAALLAVTFVALSTSEVSFMQFFGLGTALAIIFDATLVRGVLVPAFMRLMGDANWWAPAPLRWIHGRFGFSG